MPHPQDQAVRLVTEVASSQLEMIPRQSDFEAMIDRLGQAMGLLSHVAYNVLDLQNPDGPTYRARFERAFLVGLETAKGIGEMVDDPAVT